MSPEQSAASFHARAKYSPGAWSEAGEIFLLGVLAAQNDGLVVDGRLSLEACSRVSPTFRLAHLSTIQASETFWVGVSYWVDQVTVKTDTVSQDTPTENDAVTHPSHYNSGKIEVIEAIEDWGYAPGFHRGNAIKYIARAGKKNPDKEIEDLEKARWYLDRDIELLKAKKEERDVVRPNDMNPRK